jgi:hypothetical protein
MLSDANKEQIKSKPSRTKRAKKIKDYGNDPFFIKIAEDSRAFLAKHGFPKELLTKK